MSNWRNRMRIVIFEADTPAGKLFDVVLIISILMSIVAIMCESVAMIEASHGELLRTIEWFFTILFTIEYSLRIVCVTRPLSYMSSFFGVVDLLSIIPTYLSLLLPGSHYLLVIRSLRVLRVFRVLKLVKYVREAQVLQNALFASRRKITVFIFTILIFVIIIGAMMYVIEANSNSGFTSIPKSIYWAIVTMTTVGYGDIAPATMIGQTLASILMILGYGIIAVPTGIVTAELAKPTPISTRSCPNCSVSNHDTDALYCKHCGAQL